MRPYILVPTRYPSFHAPDNHFNFPLHPATENQLPFSLLTPHGLWPLYRRHEDVVSLIPHFTGKITLSHPLITVAAKLLYLARREVQPIQVPPTLIVDRPTALAQNRTGIFPTQADIIEFNRYRGSQFVDKGNWDAWKEGLTQEQLHLEASSTWLPTLKSISSKWDPDWTRLISCTDPWNGSPFKRAVHNYGVLNGLWHGRMLMPDEGSYFRIANTVTLPAGFGESFPFVTTVPVMVRLREHHCVRPARAVEVPVGDDADRLFDEGVRNGWLPGSTKFRENGVSSVHIFTYPPLLHSTKRKLEVQDQYGSVLATYETYRPGHQNSHSEDTCDVCCARIGAAEEAILDRVRERSFQQQDEDPGMPWDDAMDIDGDADTESEYGEYPEIPEEFIETVCTGIRDIVITGEVCSSIPLPSSVVLTTSLRHSPTMAKPGSTTTSTVVSDLGTVLSPSFVSQSQIQIPTYTYFGATSTAVKISSEPGVPGRPTSTAYRWKAPLASENAGTNPTNRFPLVTFQRNQTLFAFSWFSSLPCSFLCFFSPSLSPNDSLPS